MAASNRMRRIQKELADIQKDTVCGVTITAPDAGDLTHLRGSFLGPADTPYEGGRYEIAIELPQDYPFRPPKMKFITRIWHPNFSSQTGAICMDTLGTAWSPVLTLKNALLSLQSLLCTPEPKDPQDAEVAQMMIKNPDEFEHVAHSWAVKYAGAPRKEVAGGSGGATAETLKKKTAEMKKKKEGDRNAAYVFPWQAQRSHPMRQAHFKAND